jgi:hypothetical protein
MIGDDRILERMGNKKSFKGDCMEIKEKCKKCEVDITNSIVSIEGFCSDKCHKEYWDKLDASIKIIEFPNTAQSQEDFGYYEIGKGCDKIRRFYKNGEMASICWFEIIKNGQRIAEIKESVCNVYYKTINNNHKEEQSNNKFKETI